MEDIPSLRNALSTFNTHMDHYADWNKAVDDLKLHIDVECDTRSDWWDLINDMRRQIELHDRVVDIVLELQIPCNIIALLARLEACGITEDSDTLSKEALVAIVLQCATNLLWSG